MFSIDSDLTIHITRGDIGSIEVCSDVSDSTPHVFKPGDLVRFQVFTKKKHDDIVLSKTVTVETETEVVDVNLYTSDTKIGEIINKPTDYWYEVELNPHTIPQTLIGYDKHGPKIFRLYPEGGERE